MNKLLCCACKTTVVMEGCATWRNGRNGRRAELVMRRPSGSACLPVCLPTRLLISEIVWQMVRQTAVAQRGTHH